MGDILSLLILFLGGCVHPDGVNKLLEAGFGHLAGGGAVIKAPPKQADTYVSWVTCPPHDARWGPGRGIHRAHAPVLGAPAAVVIGWSRALAGVTHTPAWLLPKVIEWGRVGPTRADTTATRVK